MTVNGQNIIGIYIIRRVDYGVASSAATWQVRGLVGSIKKKKKKRRKKRGRRRKRKKRGGRREKKEGERMEQKGRRNALV